NLTFADNAHDVSIGSASSSSASFSNSIVGSAFGSNTFNGTVLSHNVYGLTLPFLAPASYDYGLRRFEPLVSDAGEDAASGGVGVIDVTNGVRVRGAHVDLGAWETSDRIFADRFDP